MALDPSTGRPEKPFFKKVSSTGLTQSQKDRFEYVQYLCLQARLARSVSILSLGTLHEVEQLLCKALHSKCTDAEAESALSQAQALIESTST